MFDTNDNEQGNNNLSFHERLENHIEMRRQALPVAITGEVNVESDLVKQEILCFERSQGRDRSKYLNSVLQPMQTLSFISSRR